MKEIREFDKVALPTMDGILFLHVREIVRCQAEGSYTMVFLEDGTKVTVSKNLKQLEAQLERTNFFRVHNSHLVNMGHIKKYIRGEGGTIVMSDGSKVELSRRRKELFLNLAYGN